jgi:tRNA-splicing ligase RtcB (3'-phosphate/5'-hydroxy nucleic acid ligase)
MTIEPPHIFGVHEPKTLEQLSDVASRAEYAALMADGHAGYVMPIGGVAAYDDKVSVVGIGFDIACGNAAIRTDVRESELSREQLAQLGDAIQQSISFGIGRSNQTSAPELIEHPLFDSPAWSALPAAADAKQLQKKARAQLGTVGSGNHYVDILADDEGRIWIGVHFGSRGLGHTIASGFLALSQGKKWGDRAPENEVLLSLDSQQGEGYWALMQLAGEYAYAGREWVARRVVKMLGAREEELVHNHHNFAWKEQHHGFDLVVVRKGATPAFPGQRGFVGGSMGDNAVIIEGATPDAASDVAQSQEAALFSTVHGAGRVMSRTEAAGKRHWRTRAVKKPGRISRDMLESWIREKGVILRGGGLDESPHVYRRLPDVLEAQGPTVKVVHTLRPLVVVMAGESEFDPYKD